MAPVVEDEQTGVEGTGCLHVHVVDVIDCLVERGVGVQVLTEAYADAFQILLQVVAGEVGSAVEAHVFEEVCQTALVLFFLHRTHLLCDVEEGSFLWPLVVAQIVSQSVVEFAYPHIRVDRQWLFHLCMNRD